MRRSAPMDARTAGRIEGVEALRAVAVTWVALFHYATVRDPAAADPWVAAALAWRPAEVVVRNGYLGVDLFFLITGFLLVMPWARNAMAGAAPPSARAFYVRRIRRIVPAYYVQLVFLFAIAAPLVLGVAYRETFGGVVALNVAAHALFLQYTTPLTSSSLGVNGALWTLTLEAQFYLLLPLLAPAFVRRPLACTVAFVLAAAAWRWLAANDLSPLVAWEMAAGARFAVGEAAIRPLLATQLPGWLAHFAAGMLLGIAWLRRRGAGGRPSAATAVVALLAGIALFGWTYGAVGAERLGPYGTWLATVLAAALVLHAFADGGLDRVVARAPALFVGRSSYSIYLYHLPLLLLWNRFRILEGSAWSFPAWAAVVLLAGAASWRLVERRFRPSIIGR